MILQIGVQMHYSIAAPTDIILQIAVPSFADQRVITEEIAFGETMHRATVAAEEGMGERTLLRVDQDFECNYAAKVEIDRPALDIALLPATPPHQLPGDAVRYLMPSRYCQSDELQSFVLAEFGDSEGGARIAKLRDWIFERFAYVPGSSNAQTTALDTFVQRKGVCRDFAHVLIALARASAIPARFASVYAPHVTPQDFHAVAEVYLDGTWHLVDATGMAAANQIARIGVGLDAAEVAFFSSFGPVTMQTQSVQVTQDA
ncbi:Transglutaminase-like superfamily protein [Loktanella fryxellensis]|uniref:Transglutaminase-like superfamily protein n=1 Tax=Loktanella fryxellensis TaxID=245187 RepID=A0A1H8A6R9_9RHOB|nr:transglutaminase family protein [Loktanella fryxellensis]SEM66592.1 Transglutaminase-like superfamily protein [Loktanella fryxellensis]